MYARCRLRLRLAASAGVLIVGILPQARAAEPPRAAAPDAVRDADRQFWAFQPLQPQKPPPSFGAMLPQAPIDAFLLARLKEQLAGDELYDWRRAEHLSPEMREALIATGYLRTARDLTHEDVGAIPQNCHNILHDTLDIVGSGLPGLTVNCARCNDHKFDPIPQQDYYCLTALLTPAYNPRAWRPVILFAANIEDRALADAAPAEAAERQRENREIDAVTQARVASELLA